MESKNAIDFIKNSSIYTAKRFKWIHPLLDKVLTDALGENDPENLINDLLNKLENTKGDTQITTQSAEHITIQTIKQITSIDCISNIGLAEIKTPMKLNGEINIIYGKNGAGKSTIYNGLCKILGKNKIAHASIFFPTKKSFCSISYIDEANNPQQLAWNSDIDNSESEVMIFDSQISNFLVEKDQLNNFELTHLKTEYFMFLYTLYERLNKILTQESNILRIERDSCMVLLEANISYVSKAEYVFDKEKLINLKFTSEDEEELKKTKGTIETLEKKDLKATIKNLSNARTEVVKILNSLGYKTEQTLEDKTMKINWHLRYTKQYFQDLDKNIIDYTSSKKTMEVKGKLKLSQLMPPEWIKDPLWLDFINRSIEFMNSITQQEYKAEKCLYCHQDLKGDNPKNIIQAYRELQKQNETNLKSKKQVILAIAQEIKFSAQTLSDSITTLTTIEAEFEHIGMKGSTIMSLVQIQKLLQEIQETIILIKSTGSTQEDFNLIESIFKYFAKLYSLFDAQILELNELSLSNDEQYALLKIKRDKLSTTKAEIENRETIIKYFEIREKLQDMTFKVEDLTAIKQITSTLKTKFMQESSVIEFKNHLQREYEMFNFSPPESWELVTSTSSGYSKRSYSFGDMRLAEIFSEGEKKIHALADFFAQLDLNEFKGVFIFDDPVTSLDEDNMEYVKERLLKLVSEGNQVIVFTHNLVFLNMLADTQKNKIHKLTKLKSEILVEPDVIIGTDKELKFKLKEIDNRIMKLKAMPEKSISVLEIRNIYDLISGYLEDYVEVVYFRNIINRYRPNIRMNSLTELKAIDILLIEKITKLYESTSRKGSRHSQPVGVPEPQFDKLLKDVVELKTNFPVKN